MKEYTFSELPLLNQVAELLDKTGKYNPRNANNESERWALVLGCVVIYYDKKSEAQLCFDVASAAEGVPWRHVLLLPPLHVSRDAFDGAAEYDVSDMCLKESQSYLIDALSNSTAKTEVPS